MTESLIADGALPSGWRKSSHSGPEAGSCLEVLDNHPLGVPVRDSKNPHGPAVIVPAPAWAVFVTAVGNGGLPS
ncbi:DUF397 domain-containing protein [Streptomyces mayonensis]|uniref:DUF397 domain-containing protein n=1 Tax=Streptomyces mayonensis TaxID=2750816 RepID=UPI001C1E20B2|nr:DUF397 domain-containing protein [Streptomyces sp. A108]MBU6532366.1 DUF397 domain-containing protein [Streptomyces sp. A108]